MGATVSAHARRYILEVVQHQAECGTPRLPAVRAMAVRCGVSLVTMHGAVRALHKEGVLSVFPGKGIYAGNMTGPPPGAAGPQPLSGKRSKWRDVRDMLARDIAAARYARGRALPSTKELCEEYGTSRRSMKPALWDLASAKLIVPYKRGFRVAGPRSSAVNAVVVLLDHGSDRGRLYIPPERAKLHGALEMACAENGTRLVRMAYTQGHAEHGFSGRTRVSGAPQLVREPVIGYVVGLKPQALSLAALLSAVGESSAPIAVFNDWREVDMADIPAKRAPVAVFSFRLQGDAGRRVGEYLLARGHRAIAYISPRHASVWCRMRLDGVRQACSSAPGAAVEAFTNNSMGDYWQRYRKSSWPDIGAQVAERLEPVASTAPPAFRHYLAYQSSHFGGAIEHAELAYYATRLFERALHRREITAWVCANDLVALAALSFLESKGIRVPGDLSVIGFDNAPGALAMALTTYDFAEMTAARAMVEFIVGAHKPFHRIAPNIDGHVVERNTTSARARR